MSLTFLSNKTTFDVTSTTTGITISGSQKSWTITATSSVTSFNLTIKNTGSSNARIDNIKLVVTTAGGGDTPVPSHAYTLNVTGTDEDAEVALYVDGQKLDADDEIAEGETVTVSVIPSDGYTYSVAVKDANNVAVEYDADNDSFTMPTSAVSITVTTVVLPTHTITFNAGSGTCNTSTMSGYEGSTITLPTATPSQVCVSRGWTFAGWTTESVNETTTAPTLLNGDYTINGDATLYAVYKVTEGNGGTETFNFETIATNNSWTTATVYNPVTQGVVTLTGYKGSSSTNCPVYYSTDHSWRMYNGSNLTVSSSGGDVSAVTSTPSQTFTINNGTATISFSATVKFTEITVTYGTSTTTYNSNPSCNPVYAVVIDDLQNGSIVATPSLAEAGEEVTLTITPAECYELDELLVYDEDNDEYVTVTDNKFDMPAGNVTVMADFKLIKYAVQYSVNGTIETALNEDVDCGNSASLWNEEYLELAEVELPEGYTFAGWSTDASSSTIVSSYTVEANATLYAVLSITETGETITVYQKVTEAPSDWSGDYLIVCETQGKVFNGTASNNYGICNDVEITDGTIEATSAIDALVVTISAVTDGYQIEVGNQYMNWTDRDFSLGTDPEAYSIDLYNTPGNENNIKICYDNNKWLQYNTSGGLRSYNSNQTPIQLYKKTTITPTTEYSYTYIKDVTGTETMASVEASHLITVKNGGVLTLTGTNNGTAANLVIEDGGQLVTNSTGVHATVEKDITAWTTGEHAGGWYFIASPVKGSIAPNTIGNLVANTATEYDLYQLDPNTTKWQNWKTGEGNNAAPGFDLVNGKGYLYANQNAVSLEFAGEVLPSNTDQAVGVSAGWNLIGNPFTCNAYLSGASYYKLKSDRTAIESSTGGDAIAPCKGVIIIIKDATNSVTFSKNAPAQNAVNNGSVQIALTEANTRGNSQLDNAIVSFNEGSELPKFYFGTQNANLYIPQNNEEYAIAYSDRQGELPVNFVANQNGEYTLSISPENVDMNYLHLIDNMTGADVDLLPLCKGGRRDSKPASYTFTAKTTDYASRFRLVFSANSCNDNDDNTPFAFVSNGEIRFVETLSETAQIQVVDMMGRVVVSRSGDVSGNVSTSGMTAGVYVIRLIDGNRVRTQKMVID